MPGKLLALTAIRGWLLWMELRNHPIMACDGVKMWPPKWKQTYPGNGSVSGEVGVLEAVFLSQMVINKVYVLTHTDEGNTYIDTLMFETADSAKAVFDFLHAQMAKPLTTIGALELPESFGGFRGWRGLSPQEADALYGTAADGKSAHRDARILSEKDLEDAAAEGKNVGDPIQTDSD